MQKRTLKLLNSAIDQGYLTKLLPLLLTTDEQEQLESRVVILQELLRDKLTQREIAKQHGLSIAKITRGSNALKQVDLNLLSFLEGELL